MQTEIKKRIEEARLRAAERKARLEAAKLPPPPPEPPSVNKLMVMPSWLAYMGLEDPSVQYRIFGMDKRKVFESNVGPQTWSLICPYDEIVIGGRRGGGKSACLKAWMSTGDLNLDEDDPARSSYLQDQSFRGLYLREEYQAMLEFIDEAIDFYRPLGGKATGGNSKPVIIEFPSGAKIFFNHLGNEEAFEKYRGWNLTRIGIEELTQIPTLKRYLKLLGSLRSVERLRGTRMRPALRTQIMATTNPDGPGACVPYGDVLTPAGWIDIKDVRVGDQVWSICPKTGAMELKEVSQVHQSMFSGELYKAEGRGLTVECTPDHKILRLNTTKHSRSQLVLEPIKNFPGQATILRSCLDWQGLTPPAIFAPKLKGHQRRDKYKQPEWIKTSDFATLLGWMVSEGSLVRRDNALCISQIKIEGRGHLISLLHRCGFQYKLGEKSILIYSRQWMSLFSWLPHASQKYIPAWVKNLSRECLENLIESMVHGDGHWDTPSSGTYYTCSKRLASDFAEIALKCGYIVYSGGRDRTDQGGMIKGRQVKSRQYSYEVAFHKQSVPGSEIRSGNHKYDVATSTKRINVSRPFHSGPVYCIGVEDNHTFIIRQNNCVWVSGNSWVIERFIDVPDGQGTMIPWNSPMRDPNTGLIRIFIPFPREANPYLGEGTAAGKKYTSMLMAQDEVTRKQWMEGDWHAGVGKYFTEYRPKGPVGEEEADKYPWACHITKPVDLKPWWYRWGSGDWGYDHPAAFHKYCRNESDQRVHVYDEMQIRRVGSFEIGALLAKWWMPELLGLQKCGQDPNITLHIGADVFSKSDSTRTPAEQIAAGIQEVLGPYGALLLKYDQDEQEAAIKDPKRAQMMFERRKAELQGHMFIALKPVYVDRVKAWSFVREWLRFRPAVLPLQTEQERNDYLTAVLAEQGLTAYELQAAEIRNLKPEVLPKVQIWSHCGEVDRCLKIAERDTSADGDPSRQSKREDVRKFNADSDGKNGDDALESFRNGCLAFQEIRVTMPRSYWVTERVSEAQKKNVEDFGEELTDPTRLAMISMRQNALYTKENSPNIRAFTPPRAGATSRRVQ